MSPDDTVASYQKAVQQKNAKAAYSLLSPELQQKFGSEEAFATFFTTYYPEIAQEAKQLSTKEHPLTIQATLPLEDNSQALLQKNPEGWSVISESIPPRAATVAQAVQGLEQLARNESSGGAIGFYLSSEAKTERSLRLKAFADLLLRVGPYDISINEAHAVVRLKDGRTLRFYLEDGSWSLVSLPEEFLF